MSVRRTIKCDSLTCSPVLGMVPNLRGSIWGAYRSLFVFRQTPVLMCRMSPATAAALPSNLDTRGIGRGTLKTNRTTCLFLGPSNPPCEIELIEFNTCQVSFWEGRGHCVCCEGGKITVIVSIRKLLLFLKVWTRRSILHNIRKEHSI